MSGKANAVPIHRCLFRLLFFRRFREQAEWGCSRKWRVMPTSRSIRRGGVLDDSRSARCCGESPVDTVPRSGAPRFGQIHSPQMIDLGLGAAQTQRRPAIGHPPGSRLVGWAKPAGGSPLVYLLPGHGPDTMRHLSYRRLIRNAVAWVASDAAREWAREALPGDNQ